MRQKIYFRILFIAILSFTTCETFAQGVGNHLTMSMQNCSQPTANTIQFDLYVVSDGDPLSDIRAGAFVYGINFNTGILQSGDFMATSYVAGTSDFIPPLNGFSFPPSAFPNHIRIAQGPYTSGNTGITMVVGHSYRVGTFVLTNTSNWVQSSNPNFSLQSVISAGKSVTAAVVWIGTAPSTTAISVTGTGNNQRSVSVACNLTLNGCSTCPPTANFESSDSVICTGGGCINFFDRSLNTPTSWQWYFPGATPSTSTQQNPTNICYNASGTYSVKLVATNANGSDSLTSSSMIVVNTGPPPPTVTLHGTDTLTSSPASSYQWYYNGTPISGATNSSYVAVQTGTYNVLITDTFGCSALGNGILVTNCSGFSISSNITNATCSTCHDGVGIVTPSGGSAPYTYTWYSGPLQNTATATGLAPGTYTVCVADNGGCAACDTVTVGIGVCSAFFNLYADTVPHQYIAVNLATGVPPLKYLWSWGDGNTDTLALPSHAYATAGLYKICLSVTDAIGCTNSFCSSFYLLKTDNTIISVKVIPPLSSDVSDLQPTHGLHLFPNPANGSVTVGYSLVKASDVRIEVYNSFGQELKELLNGRQTAGRQEMVFDVEKFAAGIYFVRVSIDGNTSLLKMLKLQH